MAARLPIMPSTSIYSRFINSRSFHVTGSVSGIDKLEFEFVKTIAVARLLFPTSYIRLSAGREEMHEAEQAWCYMAGANSIFIGDKLHHVESVEKAMQSKNISYVGIRYSGADHYVADFNPEQAEREYNQLKENNRTGMLMSFR